MDELPSSVRSDSELVVLLGLGFTTRRLARRLLARGVTVFGISRNPALALDLVSVGLRFNSVPKGATVVHTVPPLPAQEAAVLRSVIQGLQPRRIIYISSTGVYGEQAVVDEQTRVDGSTLKARSRIEEEAWIAAGPWKALVLRPAAIYGPGRGVHVRIANGEPPRAAGPGLVSRIHVDDLAAILEAAVFSALTGAWPVADDLPCSSDEINGWCGRLIGKPVLVGGNASAGGRRVDGSAIRQHLGVCLTYPSYQSGILASYAEETAVIAASRFAATDS